LKCRKSATWGKRLYLPSEGRLTEDFFARKIRRLRPGANPRSWVPEASMLTAVHCITTYAAENLLLKFFVTHSTSFLVFDTMNIEEVGQQSIFLILFEIYMASILLYKLIYNFYELGV
jgi:hypothetical protein